MKLILILALILLIAFVGYVLYRGFWGNPALSPAPAQTKLKKTDIMVGTGAEAAAGKKVIVHYVGTLLHGKKFDSSRDRGTPFAFTLGAGEVIKGWDEGVVGMKVGGKRKLVVPPDMGYGARGTPDGSIPGNAILVFEVELLKVE